MKTQNKSRVSSLKSKVLWWVCALAVLTLDARLQTPDCFADLTVTGSPGFIFSDTSAGRPTTANLNRALHFTYAIGGTVGGTNANIAQNSIGGDKLVTTFPGTNLTWDGNSPRKLVIANDGVNILQLHTNVAGLGLSGGAGTALRVNVDTNTVTITNDVLTLNLTGFTNLVNILATNVAQWAVTNYTDTNSFVSANTTFPVRGGTRIFAHGLATLPSFVRAVLVCVTNDAATDYETTDGEIEAAAAMTMFGDGFHPQFTVRATATNVYVLRSTYNNGFYLPNMDTGFMTAATDVSNFKLKIYARP